MSLRHVALLVVTVFSFTACKNTKDDAPLDISKDLPDVINVISAIQTAIDKTSSHPAWVGDSAYKQADDACTADKTNISKSCDADYEAARDKCRKEQGNASAILCTDYLRIAQTQCSARKSDNCAYVKAMAPPEIISAKLKFIATQSNEVGAGGSLKLISAEMARKTGRASSYEVELTPAPAGPKGLVERSVDEELYSQLAQAIVATLEAAYPTCRVEPCTRSARPLALKKATYSVEITYSRKVSGGFGWSISPIKIVDGKFGASDERASGNVLTFELGR